MDPLLELPETSERPEGPGPGPVPELGDQREQREPLTPSEPGTLGSRVPPAFNLLLFALTFASALLAGLLLDEGAELGFDGAQLWPALARATAFAGALIGILLAHEMGHFIFARWHRVNASWPYFLPAPYLSFIGTFGAVIRLRSLPRTRRALVDIGASGPIFGFVVTLVVIFLGLHLSQVVPNDPSLHAWTLWDSLVAWSQNRNAPAIVNVDFGESLAFKLFEYIQFGALPETSTISLHPVALAGWFGLLVTALNLLPLGQLDGGHLLYAVSPRLHRLLGPPFSAMLLALGIFTPFIGWLFWGLLTGTVLSRHPPLRAPEAKLSRGRQAIALLSLLIFAVSFAPVPLAMLTR